MIGSGLASLSAAAFLIRDGQMKGNKIHIIEELALPGGSMDGIWNEQKGYIIRGGREMEPHFETLWDLFRSIPSLDTEGASVLDEFYWLNKIDPSFSHTRVILNKRERLSTDGKLTLTPKAIEELIKLILIPEEKLQDLQIDQIFTEEFFKSNFWLYWATMFAFERWASALEMRRYVLRFISHVGKIADMSSLRFTKYNQYESLILPLVSYLKENDVHFLYRTQVQNIVVDTKNNKKVAQRRINSRWRRKINPSNGK
ncbi:oleate hydratase [Flavobacterium sp. Arc3]|uniref:oleate hydratase n=1 Tax=unclassified Flavobacterium TaxID=196869 RepID=UPI00352F1B07